MVALSAHLPHKRANTSDFPNTLAEIDSFLREHGHSSVVLGGDLNVRMFGATDFELVGPSIPRAVQSPAEKERATLLIGFLGKHGLMLCNT